MSVIIYMKRKTKDFVITFIDFREAEDLIW